MKRTIIIFGAGRAGTLAYKFYRNSCSITAFADNDTSKHGQTIEGLNILSPQSLLDNEFDAIKIASQYKYEIYSQLRDIGVDPAKLELVDDAIIHGGMMFPWTQLLTLLVAVGLPLAIGSILF